VDFKHPAVPAQLELVDQSSGQASHNKESELSTVSQPRRARQAEAEKKKNKKTHPGSYQDPVIPPQAQVGRPLTV
jgi:hypothetical protein